MQFYKYCLAGLLLLGLGCGPREYITVTGVLADKRFTPEWIQPNWIWCTNPDGSTYQIYSPIIWPDKCEIWVNYNGYQYNREVGCASSYFAHDRGDSVQFEIPKPKVN